MSYCLFPAGDPETFLHDLGKGLLPFSLDECNKGVIELSYWDVNFVADNQEFVIINFFCNAAIK